MLTERISVDFLHGHALFDSDLYAQLNAVCGDYKSPSAGCRQLLNKMGEQVGDVNVYGKWVVGGRVGGRVVGWVVAKGRRRGWLALRTTCLHLLEPLY